MTAAELRAWRTHWHLTQGQLAKLLGVHINTTNRWERTGEIPTWVPLALETLDRRLRAELLERVDTSPLAISA
jgi:DNA-binding transcriptional regulator YiaG